MLAMALVSWWYTAAWSGMVRRVEHRLNSVLSFFSVGLLLRTLFDPFRQISAGMSQGAGLDAHMRAWFDRSFSRVIGFIVRSIFIVVGILSAVFAMLLGVIVLIIWPCIPLLPIVGIVGFIAGWTL